MRTLTANEIQRADDWINAEEVLNLGGRLHLDEQTRSVVATASINLPAVSLIRIGLCMTSLSSEGFVVMPDVDTNAAGETVVIRLALEQADRLDEQLTQTR